MFRRFPYVQARDRDLLRKKEAEGDLLSIDERKIFWIYRLILDSL